MALYECVLIPFIFHIIEFLYFKVPIYVNLDYLAYHSFLFDGHTIIKLNIKFFWVPFLCRVKIQP